VTEPDGHVYERGSIHIRQLCVSAQIQPMCRAVFLQGTVMIAPVRERGSLLPAILFTAESECHIDNSRDAISPIKVSHMDPSGPDDPVPSKTHSDVDPEIGCQGHFLTGYPEKHPALLVGKRCPQKPAILHGQNPFKLDILYPPQK